MKICPLLKEPCIKSKCVAYSHRGTKIVSPDKGINVPYCEALKVNLLEG